MPDVDPLPGIEPYLDRFSELKLDERMISLLVSKGDQTDAFYKLIQEVCEAILLPLPPEEEEDLEEKLVEGDGEGEVLEGGSKSIGGEAPSEAGDTPETDGIGSGLEEEEPSDIPEDSSVPSGETEDKKESEKKPEKESRPDDIEKIDLPKEIRELLTKEPEELKKRSGTYTPFSKRKEIIPNYRSTSLKGCIARIVDKSSVSKKIKKFLKIKSKSGYNYGLERGKIHSKNIHRIFSGSDNPRIFKLKNKVELKTDTAVQIMLDCSGSMSGSKYNIGSACCVAISKTLSELRIVHEILGFSEYRCLFTYIFKGFNQNITKDRLISGFASSNIDLKENADGESVLLGAERLNVRKEKHKLMIVLSDGAPCGTYTGDGNWYLREVCKAIESSGIDLIGIGIKTESVKRFYTNHVVVNNISDLDIVLFEALKRNLLR
jgi:cobalamin biosynthesis protein CobT